MTNPPIFCPLWSKNGTISPKMGKISNNAPTPSSPSPSSPSSSLPFRPLPPFPSLPPRPLPFLPPPPLPPLPFLPLPLSLPSLASFPPSLPLLPLPFPPPPLPLHPPLIRECFRFSGIMMSWIENTDVPPGKNGSLMWLLDNWTSPCPW